MKKILVIDDDEEIVAVISQTLAKTACEISYAANGDKGFKLAKKNSFDLIITDIMLPKRDGLDIVSKIRKTQENVPIIALSGYKGMEEMSYLTGVDHFLGKPFEPKQLKSLVENLFADAEQHQLSQSHS